MFFMLKQSVCRRSGRVHVDFVLIVSYIEEKLDSDFVLILTTSTAAK